MTIAVMPRAPCLTAFTNSSRASIGTLVSSPVILTADADILSTGCLNIGMHPEKVSTVMILIIIILIAISTEEIIANGSQSQLKYLYFLFVMLLVLIISL
jgi:hypothetical protein